jgi:hypothetical protein
MAFAPFTLAGCQPIANTETTQKHPLGTIVRGVDPTYGEGEFIYLLGVTGTVVGMLVNYNATTYQTVLLTATGQKNKATPVAVAMSANVGSQYGWYQIGGNAVIKKTTVATSPNVAIYSSATAGRFKVLASAGQQIVGATTANLATIVTTTSTVVVTINRPHTQSQVT